MDSIDDGMSGRVVRGLDDRLTRKDLLRIGAALAGGAALCSVMSSSPARADDGLDSGDGHGEDRPWEVGAPRPVPGGFNVDLTGFVPENPLIHAFAPAVGLEMSTITDFKGVVAAAEVQGGARGSDGAQYWFDADMRFMQGTYIDLRGRRREHAFGFV